MDDDDDGLDILVECLSICLSRFPPLWPSGNDDNDDDDYRANVDHDGGDDDDDRAYVDDDGDDGDDGDLSLDCHTVAGKRGVPRRRAGTLFLWGGSSLHHHQNILYNIASLHHH